MLQQKYYNLLNKNFKSEQEVITEIINLEAILNLPKGTEHFMSDLHGEYDAFSHVLRNGSGNIKEKVFELFGDTLSTEQLKKLTTLIYYPEEKLAQMKAEKTDEELIEWYAFVLNSLISLTRFTSTKYTRSKVRKALPRSFRYIIDELLYKTDEELDKKDYYQQIIEKIISLQQADVYIVQLSYLIQRLIVDHLHVVGDIFDRGPAPDAIVETLMQYHSVDIQWGNHDIIWMGAATGSRVCLANVIRICSRYGNLDILEDVYGINLRPLLTLAETHYSDNPAFHPKKTPLLEHTTTDEQLKITKMHQAITIIQFKLEGKIIERRPEFEMDERAFLKLIDTTTNSITINGKTYALSNTCFPTISWENPFALLPEEQDVIDKLLLSFQKSEKLQRHVKFLIKKGSLFLRYNNNLLFHGCIPLTTTGDFQSMTLDEKTYSGKKLLEMFEFFLKKSFSNPEETDDLATDFVWYLWTGEKSSLFGKKTMSTFERYFIEDHAAHIEEKNPYYYLRDNEQVCRTILTTFGLDADKGHIINGHTPVKEIDGENPVKANGKMIVIDGGFSKAYQQTTGIGGYTLLYNSFGLQLVAHEPFHSTAAAIVDETDIVSARRIIEREVTRIKVRETNIGQELIQQSEDLQHLLKKIQHSHHE